MKPQCIHGSQKTPKLRLSHSHKVPKTRIRVFNAFHSSTRFFVLLGKPSYNYCVWSLLKYCAVFLFICVHADTGMTPSVKTTNIAVFANKYPPLTNEEIHVLQAAQLAILTHCPKDTQCFFIDPRDVLDDPKKFASFLEKCALWTGPMLAQDTQALLDALSPHISPPPLTLSFSNNSALSQQGVLPLGPSPLRDISTVLQALYKHRTVSTILVLAPTKWADLTIQKCVKHIRTGRVFFFFYNLPSQETTEDLERVIHASGPDTLFAPFGDMATLELLTASISFISKHIGLRPFIVGTSSWTQSFLTDLTLIGSLYTSLPLSKKGRAFRKHFQEVFGSTPLNIAITAYDTLCVAFERLENGPQDTHQTCRGTLSLEGTHAHYHTILKTPG